MEAEREPGLRALITGRIPLWFGFVLVHLVLGMIGMHSTSFPLGDVQYVYTYWIDLGVVNHDWVGIDTSWVYPIVALVPMLVAAIPGELTPAGAANTALYTSSWLSLIMLLDAVALATLTGWGRRGRHIAAGWWWVGFVALLGPVALGRIDAPSVSVALVGALLIGANPMLGSILVALAAWIKVWPVALIAAFVIALKQRLSVLWSALIVSGLVIVVALALGSGLNVLSFITQQTGRGLQIEAPISTWFVWAAAAHAPGASVYYDTDILTFQVTGAGTDAASAVMTPIMLLAAAAIALLGIRAVRRHADPAVLAPAVALGLVGALIVFNKVGSPQYIGWYAVPVLLGIVGGREARRMLRVPIVLVLVIAGLTQVIYPYLYSQLVGLEPTMVAVLTLRNLLLVVLWAHSVVLLVALGRARRAEPVAARAPAPVTSADRAFEELL